MNWGRDTIRYAVLAAIAMGLPLAALTGVRPHPLAVITASANGFASVAPDAVGGPASSVVDTPRRLPRPAISELPWFQNARAELAQLGVASVRLERWQAEPPLFFFWCEFPAQVAGPDDRPTNPSFSALSRSAEQATADVVQQARHWQRNHAATPPTSTAARSDNAPR